MIEQLRSDFLAPNTQAGEQTFMENSKKYWTICRRLGTTLCYTCWCVPGMTTPTGVTVGDLNPNFHRQEVERRWWRLQTDRIDSIWNRIWNIWDKTYLCIHLYSYVTPRHRNTTLQHCNTATPQSLYLFFISEHYTLDYRRNTITPQHHNTWALCISFLYKNVYTQYTLYTLYR